MKVADSTKVWLHGMAAAAIGAMGSSLSTTVVAPQDFNFSTMAGIRRVMASSLISAIVAVGLYLKASPLPSMQVVSKQTFQKDAEGNVIGQTSSVAKITTTGE